MKIMINWYVTRIVELAKELHQIAPVALTVATSSIFIQEVVNHVQLLVQIVLAAILLDYS
jgi:hypothetical protein